MAGISNLTKEQIDEYKESFEMFDLDKNGKAASYILYDGYYYLCRY